MKPLVLHPQADREFYDAGVRFDAKERGLGAKFEGEVRATFGRIQENPQGGSPYEGTTKRFWVVKRFRYIVIYKDHERFIGVYAVAHGSRRPGYWKRRRFR